MDKNKKDTNIKSRRNFLKKAAYVAPTVIALGSLVEPTGAHAKKPPKDGPGCNSRLGQC